MLGTLLWVCGGFWALESPRALPTVAEEPLVVNADTVLDPARVYAGLVIQRSGVTIDGRGAVIEHRPGVEAKAFAGVGIRANGVSNVTLKNVRVRGFELALRVERAQGWTVEDCDFSDNFTDPEFGWGEMPPRGGILWTDVKQSTIRRTKSNRNWDACQLVRCDELVLEENDFSHCSNTCLKLWTSSRNTIRKNDLSWGLRIEPGETHARDSTSVLIESGSDDNQFLDNDCTHGGDGIFIRVLNGWTSRRNYFEGNDTSYANNNGFEAWSPENTFVRNKANHCSYGFWLGASEKTRLVGNEAGFNGDPAGFHNAPESFGHGGIVFVNGPSSHTFLDGNHCHHNQGGGIVLRGDEATAGAAWKAYHWVIQRNKLEANRWGIYARHADWITLGSNEFVGNREGDFFDAGNVTNVLKLAGRPSSEAPKLQLHRPGSDAFALGATLVFTFTEPKPTAARPLRTRWDLRDGTIATDVAVRHRFAAPGIYPVGVTIDDGALADLAWRDVCIHDVVVEEFEDIQRWSVRDSTGNSQATFTLPAEPIAPNPWDQLSQYEALNGRALHARIDPYGGGRVELVHGGVFVDVRWRKELVFWLRVRNENIPAWQDANPIVTLKQDDEHVVRFVPERDLLSQPEHLEGRDGWNRFVVPLAGGGTWKREGPELERVTELALGFDSWGAPPLDIWIDGLAFR